MKSVRVATRPLEGVRASIRRPVQQRAGISSIAATGAPVKKQTAVSKRDGSTATAAAVQDSFVPEAWIRPGPPRMDDIQPLQPMKPLEQMNYSFVGMTGGQIFHEMMLRHDVKHVCKSIFSKI